MCSWFKPALTILCLFSFSGVPAVAKDSAPQILASIKPLGLIAQEVVGEYGSVDILLPIAASPHDYPLKISDLNRLREADIVLWVGAELETFLNRPLANLSPAQTLTVMSLPGVHWPSEQTLEVEHALDSKNHHHHHVRDPHVWLDPQNAVVIARALAEELSRIAPENARIYVLNAENFAKQMQALDQDLRAKLIPVQPLGFAVYHEGYLHFVQRYGLRQMGYVTVNPERRPGAKHLYTLRQILSGRTKCLFIEPYYDPPNIGGLAKELNVKVGVLDPIGGKHISTFTDLLEALAKDFLACLAEAH